MTIRQLTFDTATGEHVSTWTIDGSISYHVDERRETRAMTTVTVEEGADARDSMRRWFAGLPAWYKLRIWHDVPSRVRM